MLHEWNRGEYTISTDRSRLDADVIEGFFRQSYWAPERPRERIQTSIDASLPFGLYHQGAQIGFARVLTDYVTLAFVADVFVAQAHRGKGLGTWLVETLMSLPELRGVRRWMLTTRDAHGLYRKFGFQQPEPGFLMEKVDLENDKRA